MSRGGERGRHDGLQSATEVALVGVTASAVLGTHRLFTDRSFLLPVLFQVLVAHLTVAFLRRRQVPLRAVVALSVVLAVLSITWAQYLDTTWVMVPSPDTLSAVRGDVESAWQLFQEVRAPAPVEPGFVVVISLAVWVVAFVSDWGALRAGVSFEALLPPAILYLFGAVLGAGGGRAPGAALFLGAALVFLLLHRTWRQEQTAAWMASRHRPGHPVRRTLLSSGTGLATVAVAVGAVLGPQLPGADGDGVVAWQDASDDETRVVISPLVEIQSRLVEQPDVEVFTVQTDETNPVGAYWRLTALDTFDGATWGSSFETDDASGRLPRQVAAEATVRTVTQTISVQALDQVWLPAAHEPVSIDAGRTEVDYDPASSTLVVGAEARDADGLRYTVTSDIPRWTPGQLRNASSEVPGSIARRYLQLPDDFSPRVTDLARQVTDGEPTAYDRARALQDHLRTFEYTLEVQRGHSERALEQFLFQNRRGYCEQFAGAFAAMARALDIPSRAVVGFTRGIEDPNQRGLYHVRAEHAHAWVELYFHGRGWVMFDPTPTRGPPDAAAWLDIDEQQQGDAAAAGPGTATEPSDRPAPRDPSAGDVDRPDAGDRGGAPAGTSEIEAAPADDGGNGGGDRGVLPVGLGIVVVPLAVVVVAYLGLVPLALAVQRTARRRRTRAPVQQVELAWREVTEQFTAAGLRLSRALTLAERAAKMRLALPPAAGDVDVITGILEQATYAERPPTPADVEAVAAASTRIAAQVTRRRPRHRRALSHLDIRRLFTGPDPTSPAAAGTGRGTRRSRTPPTPTPTPTTAPAGPVGPA